MAICVCVCVCLCVCGHIVCIGYMCVQGGTQTISVHDLVCLLLQVCQCAEKVLQKEEGRSYDDSTQQNTTKKELE